MNLSKYQFNLASKFLILLNFAFFIDYGCLFNANNLFINRDFFLNFNSLITENKFLFMIFLIAYLLLAINYLLLKIKK